MKVNKKKFETEKKLELKNFAFMGCGWATPG